MQPKYRKPLNKQQLNILYCLYRFRFGSEELISLYQGNISQRYTHERLKRLVEQEYIGRRYNKSYKLIGKPASYFLLKKGIDVLKQQPERFNYQVLRYIRKDVNASDRFTRHCLNIFTVYISLKEQYGENYRFFTRSYLTLPKYDYFPKPLPDAYVSFKQKRSDTKLRHFIVECFDDTLPQSAMQKRINHLINHADSGEWIASAPYPEILLVCQTETLKYRVKKMVDRALAEAWTEELVIATATLDGLPKMLKIN